MVFDPIDPLCTPDRGEGSSTHYTFIFAHYLHCQLKRFRCAKFNEYLEEVFRVEITPLQFTDLNCNKIYNGTTEK